MEFVLKIVFVLLLVGIAALVAHIVDKIRRDAPLHHKMSFRESMDLTDLPIVTFRQGLDRYNFLLDTGSSLSIINKSVLDYIKHTVLDGTGSMYGIDGKANTVSYIRITLNYKDMNYEEDFQVLDMSAPFGNIKRESGVTIHGILSSSFFNKYKYVLDFESLIAYPKI